MYLVIKLFFESIQFEIYSITSMIIKTYITYIMYDLHIKQSKKKNEIEIGKSL